MIGVVGGHAAVVHGICTKQAGTWEIRLDHGSLRAVSRVEAGYRRAIAFPLLQHLPWPCVTHVMPPGTVRHTSLASLLVQGGHAGHAGQLRA